MSKTSCEEVLREIEQYIDGELDSTHATLLAEHLATCSPCLHHASFQARLKDILHTKCQQKTPDHLEVRIRTMLRFERFEQ